MWWERSLRERGRFAMKTLDIGVLISGSGTNLQAIIDSIANGALDCRVVLVASSNPDAYGIKRAEEAGIPTLVFNKEDYADPEAVDAKIADAMKAAGAQWIAMAGYMRMVTPTLLSAYPDKILNLHPALLPSFVGAHAIQDAWDAGVKVTGVTVHIANEVYDEGPIVAQEPVRIGENDTIEELEARIHAVEHEIYPRVLQQVAEGRLQIDGNRHVRLM